jgi:hypothetical protein
MKRKHRTDAANLIERLCADPGSRLVAAAEGYAFEGIGAITSGIAADLVRPLLASGLLREAEPGRLVAAPVAEAWLRRHARPDMAFQAQHHALETKPLPGESGATALQNLDESPVASLARPQGGRPPWLAAHAVAAAERLRRDFELGRLQPRVTANWSASVNSGRRADAGGLADLTETALAARLRVDRAAEAVGPEFSGLLVDVCCFLKGMETVERERRWPARSAKLVLRLGLAALARHYGYGPAATGREAGRLRHWGAEGYRPEVS